MERLDAHVRSRSTSEETVVRPVTEEIAKKCLPGIVAQPIDLANEFDRLKSAAESCHASSFSLGRFIQDEEKISSSNDWFARVEHYELDEEIWGSGDDSKEAISNCLTLLRDELCTIAEKYSDEAHKKETSEWEIRHAVAQVERFLCEEAT